jgi:transposase
VLVHIRPKYGCRRCEHDGCNPNIAAAPMPPQPIEKGLPGPGLLAYVVVSKLGDRLPLYRLENIFARQRVHVARSTMCAWVQARRRDRSRLLGPRAAEVLRGQRDRLEARGCDADHDPRALRRRGRSEAARRRGRRWLRQQNSVPLLARVKIWLDQEQEVVLPRSDMAAAIGYALNQWDALCVYATQGFLNIDNNASERALKRVAIGRRNWLFADHDQAARHHATLWSLIASAERHGLDPQRYLTSVLAKLPFTPEHELGQFLPDVWKCDDDATPAPTTG